MGTDNGSAARQGDMVVLTVPYAAQAATLSLVLVTDNLHEFGRIRQLRLENWLR